MANATYKKISTNKNVDLIMTSNFTKISTNIEEIIDDLYQDKQDILLGYLIDRIIKNKRYADPLDGLIFQKLSKTKKHDITNELCKHFPDGIVLLEESLNINYISLQKLLIKEEFLEADKLTNQHLCKLVETNTKIKKEWLYFTDIQFLPYKDLLTIDRMWRVYSRGKFGFSVQKKIWDQNSRKWDRLWDKISWTSDGTIRRYPQEFIWTLKAPEGHLPLSNQLRGTQTLMCLFSKIKW